MFEWGPGRAAVVLEWDPNPEQRGGPVLVLPLPALQPILQEGSLSLHAEGPSAGQPRQRRSNASSLPQGALAVPGPAEVFGLVTAGLASEADGRQYPVLVERAALLDCS